MRGDPIVMDRLIGCVLIVFTALIADVVWEMRKWMKRKD